MKIEVYSPTIRRKEMDAVLTALVEDKIGPGERGHVLIRNAREILRFDYCLALRSPAIALYIALKALGLTEGQGVLLSALSPRYYLDVLRELHLRPLYCDVEGGSPLIGKTTVEAALGRAGAVEARCVLLYHSLGFLPDYRSIAELGLPVIDDRSQSFGSTFSLPETAEGGRAENSPASPAPEGPGSGVFTILGLEERDMLTAGGGALLYAMSRRDASVLRNFAGLPPECGLPDMNAAMAVIQFRESPRNLEKRRDIAQIFDQQARRTRHRRFALDETLCYNNYAFPLILETGLKDVKAYARKKDISVEGAFSHTLMGLITEDDQAGGESGGAGGLRTEDCPEAYSLSLRTVLFPLYPRLSSAEVERVSKLILTLP
ncbi:MAG: DegT/DnrJ/EryC1/StrS family aminotransferase [Treponema sp.]|jgi:dTDP-4-amino-4,6-dideoxygalactose transaminase|nr:DegT/DnrJ/EryC1/StrS family aminotransferase [Treponema sp.]